jgi:hypothetical protein
MGFLDEITNLSTTQIRGKTPPQTEVIDWMHQRVSQTRAEDIHHTLGNGEHQAAKGNHDHDGKNGRALWAVADVPGDLPASPTTAQFRDTINQILPLLRAKAAE